MEETGSFKPDPAVYHYGAKVLERDIGTLRLIAAHDWDTHGALSAGMEAAYVARSKQPYHAEYKRPDICKNTMEDVAAAIIAADGK